MGAPTRPTGYPRWADTGATAIVEPPSGKKDVGWAVTEKPPAQFFNWLQNLYYTWIQWFDQSPDVAWQEPGQAYLEVGNGPSLLAGYQGSLDGTTGVAGGFIQVLGIDPTFKKAIYGLPIRARVGQIISGIDIKGQNGSATGAPAVYQLRKITGYTGASFAPNSTTLVTATGPSGLGKKYLISLSPSGGVTMDANTQLFVEVQSQQTGDLLYGKRVY